MKLINIPEEIKRIDFKYNGKRIKCDIINYIEFEDANNFTEVSLDEISTNIIGVTGILASFKLITDEIYRDLEILKFENKKYYSLNFLKYRKEFKKQDFYDSKMTETHIKDSFLLNESWSKKQEKEIILENDLQYIRRIKDSLETIRQSLFILAQNKRAMISEEKIR